MPRNLRKMLEEVTAEKFEKLTDDEMQSVYNYVVKFIDDRKRL